MITKILSSKYLCILVSPLLFLTFDSFDVKTCYLSLVIIVSLDLNNDFTFELHFWCSLIGIFRTEADKDNYRNSITSRTSF